MKLKENYWPEIKFIFLAHIFNPLWKPRTERRRRRGKYSYEKVEKYLEKYLPFVRNINPGSNVVEKNEGSEKIFSIWFQGEENAPELVKVCFRRLRETYGDRYIVLDNKNLRKWVKLPEFIWQKWEAGKITHAHLSDICRVALLYQNGGIWFDATDYLTAPVPIWIEESDLFIYLEGNNITPGTLIQSCFMRARKGHPLFKAWLDFIFHYWEQEDKLVHYFLLHYMLRFLIENNSEVKRLFEQMPQINQDPTHILWHLHHKEPYSKELYLRDTKDSFFQKTSFKRKSARVPKPGSVAEVIIQGKGEGVKK